MRYYFENATIFTDSFTIADKNCSPMCIEIERGEIYVFNNNPGNLCEQMESDTLKAEREKVWEMAEHILRIPYTERLKYFGTSQVFDIVSMPVDQALDMYESWKKANSVEEIIKSLKPQDVVAVPKLYEHDSYCVYMVTMVNPYAEDSCIIRGVDHTGDVILNRRTLEEYKGLEKIGRVVETTDILGEIKKIEDEWRKNN